MVVSIYADGSGSPKGGFGWFVKETGESHYEHHDTDDITNNQAEYMAIISAIKHAYAKSDKAPYNDRIVVYSDSLNTVKQINHEYAINNSKLRELAMQAWSELARFDAKDDNDSRPLIVWIRRDTNLAGKMLGS